LISALQPAKLHINYEPRKIYGRNIPMDRKNHDNKVDEKCDGSGKGTKKGRFQIALESASIIYGR
jgi:hypothetical protein